MTLLHCVSATLRFILKEKKMSELENKKKIDPYFLFRYVVSGASSVVAQFVVLTSMIELLHANPTLSSGSGYFIGCVVQYLLLYYWTFKSTGKHLHVALKYTLVLATTLVLNVIVFWVLVEVFHL